MIKLTVFIVREWDKGLGTLTYCVNSESFHGTMQSKPFAAV